MNVQLKYLSYLTYYIRRKIMEKTVLVFPSDVNMSLQEIRTWFDKNKYVRKNFKEASRIFGDMFAISNSFENKNDDYIIEKVTHIKRLLYILSYSLCEYFINEKQFTPDICVGKGVGEISALTYAGSITFQQGCELAVKIAQLYDVYNMSHYNSDIYIIGMHYNLVRNSVISLQNQGYKLEIISESDADEVIVSGDSYANKKLSELLNLNNCFSCEIIKYSLGFSDKVLRCYNSFVDLCDNIILKQPKIPVYSSALNRFYKENDNLADTYNLHLHNVQYYVSTFKTLSDMGYNKWVTLDVDNHIKKYIQSVDKKAEISTFNTFLSPSQKKTGENSFVDYNIAEKCMMIIATTADISKDNINYESNIIKPFKELKKISKFINAKSQVENVYTQECMDILYSVLTSKGYNNNKVHEIISSIND